MQNSIIYREESAQIYGAIFEVHKRLGPGLLEKAYQEALSLEFQYRKIPFEREKQFNIYYRNNKLETCYIADFICYDKIIIELKAVSAITDVHKAQVVNYLTIANYKLGILCNFNDRFIKPIRIINNEIP